MKHPTLFPNGYAEARLRSPWYGPDRPQLPPALGGGAPHLTGIVAGDYGFDPLGLGVDPAAFQRNLEAELVHARCILDSHTPGKAGVSMYLKL